MSKPSPALRREESLEAALGGIAGHSSLLDRALQDAAPSIATARSRAASFALFGIVLIAVVALQLRFGAYAVERGVYSDDAAHFMNGLVIRDYLYTAFGSDPMAFAEQYYLSYPKIAPLMWPPLFHVVLGLLLLPGWPPGPVALLLIGLASTWTVWRFLRIVRQIAGPVPAVIGGVLYLTTPLVLSLTTVVMLDMVLAAMALEAAYWLARFTQSGSMRHGILFGAFTALACMTKGNGVALVLMPLVLMLVTGRYELLRRPGLYAAAGIVVVIAMPFVAINYRFDASIGDFGPVTATVVAERLRHYAGVLWNEIGLGGLTMAAVGIVAALTQARRHGDTTPPFAAAFVSLIVATIAFHLFNPHKNADSRYMMMAIAPICGLTIFGVSRLAAMSRSIGGRRLILFGLLAAMVFMTIATRPLFAARRPLGYRDVLTRLSNRDGLGGRKLLVVSDEVGEGACVSEIAVLGVSPQPTILRGSKMLSLDTWTTRGTTLAHPSAAALLQDLRDLHVQYVLVDSSSSARQLTYYTQVAALTAIAGALELVDSNQVSTAAGPVRPLSLYRLTSQSAGPAKRLEIDLSPTIGRRIRR